MNKKVKESPDDWTKEELKLRTGIAELAAAIVKQWIKDGRPKCDSESINIWIKISHSDPSNNKTDTFNVSVSQE